MGKNVPLMPDCVRSIRVMLAVGVHVRVRCTACRLSRDVDLRRLEKLKGPDYSLLNRRCRCRLTPGCPGWNRFSYAKGEGCSFWNLWDEATMQRWIDGDYRERLAAEVKAAPARQAEKRARERR